MLQSAAMDPLSSLVVIIASLFLPPLGIFLISGCSVDLLISFALTLLGYFPGLLHALYLLYVYYSRREDATNGIVNYDRAPGVYSDVIQRGGLPAMLGLASRGRSPVPDLEAVVTADGSSSVIAMMGQHQQPYRDSPIPRPDSTKPTKSPAPPPSEL
ncbi:uncharacterized protein V1518DRAFT_422062 [Limtongia smithiae]|uniref:uncharacterized protein n=1 Tax=Limtongia smithiae TaxID=1125753 RepID=UPI0034CF7A7D